MPLAAVTFFATTNGKYQILGVKFAIDIQVYQARLFASLFFETFSAFSFQFVRQNTFFSISSLSQCLLNWSPLIKLQNTHIRIKIALLLISYYTKRNTFYLLGKNRLLKVLWYWEFSLVSYTSLTQWVFETVVINYAFLLPMLFVVNAIKPGGNDAENNLKEIKNFQGTKQVFR